MNDRHDTPEALNDAWDALHNVLPARWHVGKPSYDPGHRVWSVTAWGPLSGRPKAPSISGTGDDEAAALRDLNVRLRDARRANRARMDELHRQLRMAYLEGAEAFCSDNLGRGITVDELGRIAERYAGR
jgi:hypothetical protein